MKEVIFTDSQWYRRALLDANNEAIRTKKAAHGPIHERMMKFVEDVRTGKLSIRKRIITK